MMNSFGKEEPQRCFDRPRVCAYITAVFIGLLVIGCGPVASIPSAGSQVSNAAQPEAIQVESEPAVVEVAETEAEVVGAAGSETVGETAEIAESTSNTSGTSDAAVASEAISVPLSGVSQDYTLVGATGRPQLVFTYADW